MDESLPVEGLLVLAATGLTFIVILVSAVVRSYKYHWPRGYVKTVGRYKDQKVTLLTPKNETYVDMGWDVSQLARRCAIATYVMKEQWFWPAGVRPNVEELRDTLDWTVCWFKTEDDFEATVRTWNREFAPGRPAAHTGTITKKGFGGGLPACIIRHRYIDMVYENGHPFEHELTHHLLKELMGTYDRTHSISSMWLDYRLRIERRYKELTT